MTKRTNDRARLGRRLLQAAVVLGLAACMARFDPSAVPNGWWKDRGPVVPHDSFPADCSLCHQGEDWHTIRADFHYDHAAETGYALEGAHAAAQCLRCHNDRGPVQLYAQRGCAGCHEDVHTGKLGQDCSTCHGQSNWQVSQELRAHQRTRFPLVGAHVAAPCWRCHTGALSGNFAPTDVQCVTCHRDDLARATNPDHAAQGWVDRCDRCHIPTIWSGGGFNHGIWPLTGKHATADCSLCHIGGVFAGTPNQCVDCHLADYQGAANPDHVLLNFSTACQNCHSTNGWIPATFDHTGITNGCVTCHQADYDATTNPNHAQAGFGTNCEQCHNTQAWVPASFDHTGITNGCSVCHLPDYNATTNPDHQKAGFPTTCETCHNTKAWIPAPGWNHSFPITKGKHKNLACSDCHLVPTDYLQFSCINCHEHNQSKMASEHKKVNNYVWDSNACLSCHPNGKAPFPGPPGPPPPRRPGSIRPERRPGGAGSTGPAGGGGGGGPMLAPWATSLP